MNAFNTRTGQPGPPVALPPIPAVVALHCSGADGTQWQHLSAVLEPGTDLVRPDLAGPEAIARGWSRMTYNLAEEAKPIVASLTRRTGPAHLVGHS